MTIEELRLKHHRCAQLAAEGKSASEVAQATGSTTSRSSSYLLIPPFKNWSLVTALIGPTSHPRPNGRPDRTYSLGVDRITRTQSCRAIPRSGGTGLSKGRSPARMSRQTLLQDRP